MNIGVFSTHVLWPTHFETELEIIQKHIDNKDNVIYYGCSGKLKHCELIFYAANFENKNYDEIKELSCKKCIKKQSIGLLLLSKKIHHKEFLNEQLLDTLSDSLSQENLSNHETLKKCFVNNYDVGWSLLSSLISDTRNPFVELTTYEKELKINYKESVAIYFNTINEIKNNNLEAIYVFNGRLSYTKAIFRAAEYCGVNCYIHERGSSTEKYGLFHNHLPHDILKFKENVYKIWDLEENDALKNTIAAEFFKNRRNGIIGSWKPMIELQKTGYFPKNWNSEKINICLFTSSDDEFASIDDTWKNPYFDNQLSIISFISELMKKKQFSNYHFYTRIHPNARRLSESYIQKLMNFDNGNNVAILHPESPVSSYSVLDNSDIIITVGSTIGYESVYAGKYTIQLGKSLYYGLEGPINPESIDNIEELLLNPQKINTPLDTIKLGYYMQTYGIPYKYYRSIDYRTGHYRGFNLDNEVFRKNDIVNKIKFFTKKQLFKYIY